MCQLNRGKIPAGGTAPAESPRRALARRGLCVRWAGWAVAFFPVVRSTLQMSDRHNDDVGRSEMVDDLVRESTDQNSARRSTTADDHANLRLSCDQRHRAGDCIVELCAKPATPFLVPPNRRLELGRGELKALDPALHRPRISFSIRRFTSSQGSRSAVPDSMAETLRSISAAHAASASGSAGPSRLARISAASSARASTSSRRASARTASAGFVMGVILLRRTPPNNRLQAMVGGLGVAGSARRASPAAG